MFYVFFSCSLFFSCSRNVEQGGLLEIKVNFDGNSPLVLSEIAESVTAIELELTDESTVNPDDIRRIFLLEENVIVVDSKKIFLFDAKGKFVRIIGSKGQGPGEYIRISNAVLDNKK